MRYFYDEEEYETLEDIEVAIHDDITNDELVSELSNIIETYSTDQVLKMLTEDAIMELYDNVYTKLHVNKVDIIEDNEK